MVTRIIINVVVISLLFYYLPVGVAVVSSIFTTIVAYIAYGISIRLEKPYKYDKLTQRIYLDTQVIEVQENDVKLLEVLLAQYPSSKRNLHDTIGFCQVGFFIDPTTRDTLERYLPLIEKFRTTPPEHVYWFTDSSERIKALRDIINLLKQASSIRFNIK